MDNKNNDTGKKAAKSIGGMFKRFIGKESKAVNVLEEEAVQTPVKTIINNYFRSKLGIIGLVGFIIVFLFCFVGSILLPLDSTYIELPNADLQPGTNYLSAPSELQGKNIVEIASGVSFSAAITDEGEFYIWGTEPNKEQENVSDYIFDVPEEVYNNKIVDIACGGKHILAIDENDVLYGWGYYGNNQTIVPANIAAVFEDPNISVTQIAAATQWTALLGSDGNIHIWGSTQSKSILLVPGDVDGRIQKVAAGDNNMALLLDDGTIRVIGDRGTEFATEQPENTEDGSVNFVDLVATNRNVLALDDEGNLHLWGSRENGLSTLPEITADVKAIDAGYSNFTVLLETGEVLTWGSDDLGQLNTPNLENTQQIFADYYQFYAVDSENNITAWGNEGYTFGSDQFGRDILTRVIHGGRISLTVGAVAVIIQIVIALFVGLTAGYFGGIVDNLLMRMTDIFTAIPFYPIAITLSYAIGNDMDQIQRMFLIMVILGLLGWMPLARLIRAQLLLEREKDFVLAARALGIKQNVIMWRHILPNIFNLVIVNITLGYASSLLSEAALSFLGFGVAEPTPSWGNMLTSAQSITVIEFYWWRWVIPALFVIAAALCANLIGDALREAMDPKANEK